MGYNEHMVHKAVFFNFARWGEEGRSRIASNSGLKNVGIEVAFADDTLDVAHLPEDRDFDIAGVFMDSKLDAPMIAGLPNLRFITTLSTGFDHIDLKAAAEKGIIVSSVPAYGENTVAEFAFVLLLALSRKICEARDRVRKEGKFTTDGLQGFDLAGKTIGVLGTGHIGKHAVRMAKGFGMKIIAYDVYHDDAFAKEMNFPYVTLEELLAQSDIVTIHCPYLPSTHHLINKSNVHLAKQGAYIINTSRGAVVETAAIVAALKGGQLGGAGLDVLEEEDAIKAGDMSAVQELITMPNVIVTPHNAFNTREAAFRILDTTIENILAFAQGAPINIVK
jgi:D-lactate dehydrogenase